MGELEPSRFWRYAFAYRDTATPQVLPRVLIFGLLALIVTWLHSIETSLAIPVGPVEVSGAVIALILVLRTNSGYERWWEARKLWGGIVNQSRNLAIAGLSYGPNHAEWKRNFIAWASAFPHIAKKSLRGERDMTDLVPLIGTQGSNDAAAAQHVPSYVSLVIAGKLEEARKRFDMDPFAFLQIDRERAQLIDHIGACERILKTPLAFAYAVKIRRFIVLYLLLVPFGLVESVGWYTPFVTMFISYPILGLDHIGTELQNPFSKKNLSHLPLDEISVNIEKNLKALLDLNLEQRDASSKPDFTGHDNHAQQHPEPDLL